MDPGFWHQRWAKNEIGFHEPKANPLLVTHFKGLSLSSGGRVFVTLFLLILSGCSTVERYTYFSPQTVDYRVEGPRKPSCGFKAFGGKPDTVSLPYGNEAISIESYQDTDPWFFGPWF